MSGPTLDSDGRLRRPMIKTFAHIVSPLDPADHRSGVHTSEFRGIYNLAIICAALYTFTTCASSGSLDWRLLLSVFYSRNLLEVLVTFAMQGLFSYTALLPVYMSTTRWFSSRFMINSVHHILQSIFFFGTVIFIVYRDWGIIHAVSAFIECLVLLMKMHSYIRTTLELARRDDKVPSLSIKDFSVYLFHPTLVYEPHYPRTDKIRWGYLVEKLIANILAMCMLYLIITDHVMPTLEDTAITNPILSVIHLLLPFLGCYLMIWFILFECICNGVAELTYLADRDFYSDWWNSTTFDEFAQSLETYKLSRRNATTLTFFISAIFHECVFVIMFRTIKMYFFILQMLQVLIIVYGRGLKGTRVGNYIFWLGMILGLPLQAVIYCREYHGGEPIFMDLMIPIMIIGLTGVSIGSFLMMQSTPHTEEEIEKKQN